MPERNRKPFICVTGPTTPKEIEDTAEAFRQAGLTSGKTIHQPVLGIATIAGLRERRKGYAMAHELPFLLKVARRNGIPATIHFNTSRQDNLVGQVDEMFEVIFRENASCDGLQLNRMHPHPRDLRVIKQMHPNVAINIQISYKGKSPRQLKELAQKLKHDYGDGETIAKLLMDSSMGTGTPFAPEEILPCYEALDQTLPNTGKVVAGGYSGDNVKGRLIVLRRVIGTNVVSVDAEGQLKDSNGDLHPGKVRRYTQQSKEGLTS
jgi:hypothetical protein